MRMDSYIDGGGDGSGGGGDTYDLRVIRVCFFAK